MCHSYSSHRLPLMHTRIDDLGRQTMTRTRLSSYRLVIRRVGGQEMIRYQLGRLIRMTRRVGLNRIYRYYRYHFPCT